QPPYLVMDGRRMLPDFDTLVADGYDYLPVGGPLMQGGAGNSTAPDEDGSESAMPAAVAQPSPVL
nr:hypothetical protein [Promineifilum sp.]